MTLDQASREIEAAVGGSRSLEGVGLGRLNLARHETVQRLRVVQLAARLGQQVQAWVPAAGYA